jgi:hypothetical protein
MITIPVQQSPVHKTGMITIPVQQSLVHKTGMITIPVQQSLVHKAGMITIPVQQDPVHKAGTITIPVQQGPVHKTGMITIPVQQGPVHKTGMIAIPVRQHPIHHALLPIAQAGHPVVNITLDQTLPLQARTRPHNATIIQARGEDIATTMAIQATILVAHVQRIHNVQEAISLNNANALMDLAHQQPSPATALLRPHVQILVQAHLLVLAIGLRVLAIGLRVLAIGLRVLATVAAADDLEIARQLRLIAHKSAE